MLHFNCVTLSSVTKDILFVLDSSESIGEFVFYGQIIPVVENFVRFHTLELDPLNTQVGMIAFGGRQQRYIPMNNNATKDKLINALGVSSLPLSLSLICTQLYVVNVIIYIIPYYFAINKTKNELHLF